MACDIQNNTIKLFQDKNILDNDLNIIDKNQFNFFNDILTKRAMDLFSVNEGPLFIEYNNIAKPNKDAFNSINDIIEKDSSINREEVDFNDLVDNNIDSLFGLIEEEDFNDYSEEVDIDNMELNEVSRTIEDKLKQFYDISKNRPDSQFNNIIEGILFDISNIKEKYKDLEERQAKLIILKYTSFMNSQMKSIKDRINKIEEDNIFSSDFYHKVDNYMAAFKLIKDVRNLVVGMYNSGDLSSNEYNKFLNYIKNTEKEYLENHSKIRKLAEKDILNKEFLYSEIKEPEVRFKNQFQEEAKALFTDKNRQNEYVNSKMAENRERIKSSARREFKKKLNSNIQDITSIAKTLNNEKALNNFIIQVLSNVIDKNHSRITDILQPKMIEHYNLMRSFIGSNNKSSDKIYQNLIEQDSEGNYYLKGEYSIKFKDEYNKQRKLLLDILENPVSSLNDRKQAKNKFKQWRRDNILKVKTGDGVLAYKPILKWKRQDKLSPKEQEILDHLIEITKQSSERTLGRNSLVRIFQGAIYYKLPSVRKSVFDRILNGDLKNTLSEYAKETFTKQSDQTDEGQILDNSNIYEIYTGLDNQELNILPIHFRGYIEPKDQSLDLGTIYALELENSIKYENRYSLETDLTMFKDVISTKKFVKGSNIGSKFFSLFGNKRELTYDGADSNTIQMFETILKTRLYDKTKEYGGKIGKTDVNKLTSALMKWTGGVGMALNYFSAPANFVIGNVNNLLAIVEDSNLNMKNLQKASDFYRKDFSHMIDDIGKNVDKSIVNQILRSYNTFGEFRQLKSDFVKNTKAKSLFKMDTLQFMHNVGEHAMQGVLTLSVLDSIKVLNKKGQYLNKEGSIVKDKSKAASLLDVQTLDSKGNLTTSIDVKYTDFENIIEFDKGGKDAINSLIKQKILRTHGNYDATLKSQFQKNWYGSLMMMYKKHIEVPMLNRFRGLSHFNKDNPEEFLNLNYSIKTLDEGTYSTLARFIYTKLLPSLKAHKLGIIKSILTKEDFKNLNDWEKANINRAILEINMIIMFSITAALLAGMADDDDKSIWFVAYLFRRAESDLKQYYSPSEAWRILTNPFASIKQVQFGIDLIETTFAPWTWDDTYQSGIYKGENKLWRRVIRNIPIITRKDLTAKQAYNYLDKGR